jgi:hypothetical protein
MKFVCPTATLGMGGRQTGELVNELPLLSVHHTR